MGRATGARAKLAGTFESVYGTPPAASGQYFSIPFASSQLGAEQPLIEDDLLGQGREGFDPVYDFVTNDGDLTVPVDVRYFGYWLKMLFGAPTTTGSGPYTHAFASGASAIPSMAIETQHPAVPSYAMSYGLRANQMRIQMQRSGMLNAVISLIGKGEAPASASTAAGTLAAALGVTRFAQRAGVIKRDGVTLASIVSAELVYSNNLEKVETIHPDGEIEDADLGPARANGNLVAKFSSRQLLTDATDGTPVELSWEWQIDPDWSLTFTAHRVFLPRVKQPIEGPRGLQARFDWQASGEGAPCLTAVLVNDKASY